MLIYQIKYKKKTISFTLSKFKHFTDLCDWTGSSSKETWACCTDSKPCGIAEGDCDTNDECIGHLVCGSDNCVKPPFHKKADCCYDPTTTTTITTTTSTTIKGNMA